VSIRTANNSAYVSPGEQVTIIATVSDEVGVTSVHLDATGAFTFSDSRQVSPPLGSGEVEFSMTMPAEIADGQVINVQATARDISGNTSDPATLVLTGRTLSSLTLPSSMVIEAGEDREVTLTLSSPAPRGGLYIDFASDAPSVAVITPSVLVAEGETSAAVTLSGLTGGNARIMASIQGTNVAAMTVTVRGGIVTGTVYDSSLVPVGGADVSIRWFVLDQQMVRTTVTDANGRFMVEGISAREVTVRVLDPATSLLGYLEGQMSAPNGYLRDVSIVLRAAGTVIGTVYLADGRTVAGEGVQVDLYPMYQAENRSIATLFTNAQGMFEIPLVEIGNYRLLASAAAGNYGQTDLFLRKSGEDVTSSISFLGKGSVEVQVVDGNGAPIPNAVLNLEAISMLNWLTAPDRRNSAAAADGTAVFSDVLVGDVTVWAKDPVTGYGASGSGSISADGETVNITLQLTGY
jgi:5-hydroxyisourate hydrolase-like protein (transthyretin family)